MLNWANAHRIAMTSALRLQRELDIDVTARVSPLEIADRLGLTLRIAPLPRLAGAYIRQPGTDPGILINNRHPPAKQRYTTGHEIGHHVHGHGTSLDDLTEVDQNPRTGLAGIPDQERVAEAFAAWLLMPRALIMHLIAQTGSSRNPTPAEVYQLSLRLGTSYQATNLQLANLKLQTHQQSALNNKIAPQKLKQAILGRRSPGIGAADVHHIRGREFASSITVAPNDIIVVELQGRSNAASVDNHLELVDETRDNISDTTRLTIKVGALSLANPATPPSKARVEIGGPVPAPHLDINIEHPFQGVSQNAFEDPEETR